VRTWRDPDRIQQVVWNTLEATPSGSRPRGGRVTITGGGSTRNGVGYYDSALKRHGGPGPSPAEQPPAHLRGAFKQVDSLETTARLTAVSVSSLGLAIVRHLVEATRLDPSKPKVRASVAGPHLRSPCRSRARKHGVREAQVQTERRRAEAEAEAGGHPRRPVPSLQDVRVLVVRRRCRLPRCSFGMSLENGRRQG